MKKSNEEQISYWLVAMLVSIGNGTFHSTIYEMKSFYQQEAYERGLKAAKNQ